MPTAILKDIVFNNQEEYIKIFDTLISNNYVVIINHDLSSIQDYFHKMNYRSVGIYCVGIKERQPYNIGKWEECHLRYRNFELTRMGDFVRMDDKPYVESFDFITNEGKTLGGIPFEHVRKTNVFLTKLEVMDCIINKISFFVPTNLPRQPFPADLAVYPHGRNTIRSISS